MKSPQNINNNSENEDEHVGAFQRVSAKAKPSQTDKDNVDSGLRRSARARRNGPSKATYKKSSSFQQSESINENSISESHEDDDELNDDNDLQPLK